MRRALRAIGAVTTAALVFFATGELLARTTGILDRLNGYTRLLYVEGPDADLPYLLRPDVTTTLRGITIRTNRLGLREAEITPFPPAGTRRVLLLGDSVVFGQELPDEQILARQLERALVAAGKGPVQVVNMGVPGYDTVSEMRLLETLGPGLHPDAVVLGLSLNDHDVTPQYSPFGLLMRKDLDRRAPDLADHSEFLTLLRWVGRWLRGDLAVQMQQASDAQHQGPPGAPPAFVNAPRVVASVRDDRLAFYRAPTPAYWDRMRAALAAIGRHTAERGLPLLVAIFPESYQMGPDADRTPQARLLAACDEAHVRCVDLQPVFTRAGGTLFHDVSHPNAAGHALAAHAIAAALPMAETAPRCARRERLDRPADASAL